MRTLGLSEARSHFKEIVDAAAKGEVVRITRNGKIVVEMRAAAEDDDAYWRSVKPLNIGKGGLSRLLLEERQSSR